jgi:hypothetical protein
MNNSNSLVGGRIGSQNTIIKIPSSTALKNAISTAIAAGKLVLGVKANYESWNNGIRTYYLHSGDVKLRIYYTPQIKQVVLNQKLSSGQNTGQLKKWETSQFGQPFNAGTTLPLYVGMKTVLLSDQSIISNEKYNNWNSVQNNIINHGVFSITQNTNNIDANFKPTTNGIVIKNSILENSSQAGGTIELKDPWLIDYTDPLYGSNKRNQGISAPFKSRTSPLAPDYTTSYSGDVYKGTFLNQNPTFDANLPIYSVRAQATQTIGGVLSYFQNWSSSGATLQNASALETPMIFTSSGATVTANYKGVHLSNDATAFSNNSQRKFVQTPDGYLHMVYESAGRVWYETKAPSGSWQLMNNSQPLDNGAGKRPSIDWHYNCIDPNNTAYYAVVVAYQQQSGSTYTIEYAIFTYTNGSYVRHGQDFTGPLYTEPSGGDQYSSTNANPNIAWGKGDAGPFVLSFERKNTIGSMQPGIYWVYGYMYEGGISPTPAFPTSPIKISGTSGSSINAAVSLDKLSAENSIFDIVYQTSNSSITDLTQMCYYSGGSWNTSQSSYSTISSMSGYLNYQPSLVQMPDNNIRVCWIRDMYGMGSNTPYYVNVVYWDSQSPSVFNYSGNMVNSVSLNIRDGNTNTYYAYAQNTNNSAWQNFARNGSNTITLNTTGRQIQLCNGSSSASMYASAYYPVSAPYYRRRRNLR